ncbi:hypothetical protein [Nocardia sp. alder85J]|uniref:hypothetical protein n=1 Tax=Nocardia sp. alder85J TaxID=2862949 RepID=UPI001CD4005B|nr:hypothetical protein [Nocardia sp. alder85J]MCX4097780.1 hypothetical protein [Nocardia sp. alder85J]
MDFEIATARAKARTTSADSLERCGWRASAIRDHRYRYELPGWYRNRRRCHCGCGGKISHGGAANGLALTGGREMSMQRRVLTGKVRSPAETARRRAVFEAEVAEARARQQDRTGHGRRARRPPRSPAAADTRRPRLPAGPVRVTGDDAGPVPLARHIEDFRRHRRHRRDDEPRDPAQTEAEALVAQVAVTGLAAALRSA